MQTNPGSLNEALTRTPIFERGKRPVKGGPWRINIHTEDLPAHGFTRPQHQLLIIYWSLSSHLRLRLVHPMDARTQWAKTRTRPYDRHSPEVTMYSKAKHRWRSCNKKRQDSQEPTYPGMLLSREHDARFATSLISERMRAAAHVDGGESKGSGFQPP